MKMKESNKAKVALTILAMLFIGTIWGFYQAIVLDSLLTFALSILAFFLCVANLLVWTDRHEKAKAEEEDADSATLDFT